MMRARLFLGSALAVGALGCSIEPLTPPPPFAGANSYAELQGAALGSGQVPVAQLRKALTVNVSAPNPSLSVERAFALRGSATNESVYLAVEVKNVSDRGRCFIRAESLALTDAAGAPLDSQSGYVTGSVGMFDGSGGKPIFTDTCLAAGERGVLHGIFVARSSLKLFTPAAGLDLRFEATSAAHESPKEPTPRVLPQSYTVASGSKLAVEVKNLGTARAKVSTSSRYLLADAQGPLMWGFFSLVRPTAYVEPGGVATLEDTVSSYGGRAERLRVMTDFELDTVGSSGGALTAAPEGLERSIERRLLRRNAEEDLRRDLVQ